MVWKITFGLPKYPHLVCRAQRCLLPLFWNLLGTPGRCHAALEHLESPRQGELGSEPCSKSVTAFRSWPVLSEFDAVFLGLDTLPGWCFWILRLKGFHLMNLMGDALAIWVKCKTILPINLQEFLTFPLSSKHLLVSSRSIIILQS